MDYQEYYTELGRLLYAIAKVDGKVQKRELDELKKIVKVELVKLVDSTDEFNTALAYATEFEFEVMQDRNLSSEEAFHLFSEYIYSEPSLPPKLRTLAYRSAIKVADSFHGTNHQEAELLHNLKELLREHPILKL